MSTTKHKLSAESGGIQISTEMKKLLEHQYQINLWLMQAEQKIYQLEEAYLTETPLGNIVRGWGEVEASQKAHQKSRVTDEKERIFSSSSLKYFGDNKSLASEILNAAGQPAKKKAKKSISSGGRSEKDGSKFRNMLFEDGDTSSGGGAEILSNDQFDDSQLEMEALDDIYS
jgi:hypothetical protein